MSEQRNLLHLELFRIFAIYAVIFNHTKTNGFLLFSVAEESSLYWFYLFISILCKFAVPLFYMVSGACLLKKEESIGAVYKKRILRMLVTLILISVFYSLYDSIKAGGAQFDAISFLKTIYSSRMATPLWYLYSYIALLTMLPLLRKLAKNLTIHEYAYMAAMSFLMVGIIPILEYRLFSGEITMYSQLKGALFTSTSIVYFLMGYFFEYVLPQKYYTAKNACISLIASVLCIVICCYMTNFQRGILGGYMEGVPQTFHNSLIAVPTYSIYFGGKLYFMKKKIPSKIQRGICVLGSTTFGIYLLEKFLRSETVKIVIVLKPLIRTLPACMIWVTIVFLLGFIIIFILKKIPLFSKYI